MFSGIRHHESLCHGAQTHAIAKPNGPRQRPQLDSSSAFAALGSRHALRDAGDQFVAPRSIGAFLFHVVEDCIVVGLK
jgi:hypothetical protein